VAHGGFTPCLAIVFLKNLRQTGTIAMADDKKKAGPADRNLISFRQKYEFDYAARQLQKQVPEATRQQARDALTRAARQESPSEGRERIMRAARKLLGH